MGRVSCGRRHIYLSRAYRWFVARVIHFAGGGIYICREHTDGLLQELYILRAERSSAPTDLCRVFKHHQVFCGRGYFLGILAGSVQAQSAPS